MSTDFFQKSGKRGIKYQIQLWYFKNLGILFGSLNVVSTLVEKSQWNLRNALAQIFPVYLKKAMTTINV